MQSKFIHNVLLKPQIQICFLLFTKENPITSEGLRWNFKHPGLSQFAGMFPKLHRLDAQFFAVHYRLGNYIDPMSRKILEQTYQAYYDAVPQGSKMTPKPQEHVSTREGMLTTEHTIGDASLDGERIVITGMAGLYPKCHNVKELSEILYNKENPITSEGLRWNFKHPELPQFAGMAPELDRFDAQFFAVHYRLGNYMDPMSRKILEQTYQALYDAGLSPSHFNGKNVAVFVGSSFSDSENNGPYDNVSRLGLGILGTSKTMFANRISYWLNTKGPSLAIDETDCSSTVALEQAYLALKRGACEAAIVGGTHLSLYPQASIHHGRLAATVVKDGKTKSFAQNADGYILSDAVGVIILQKAKDALRIYAELSHVRNEFVSLLNTETGPKFGHYRNPQHTVKFIKQFYEETQVTPDAVEFVEAYGTGVPDADKAELEAIEQIYCLDREAPLLVGSVTSNIGLTNAASGVTAITKVLLSYYTGQIAANLHCSSPREDVAALREGRMCVVTEHQRFQRTYVAINGMSVTGVNSHVLLHGRYKPKDLSRYKSSIPRLVTISGRQESSIDSIIENLKSRPVDAEEMALLHNIHVNNISGHLSRGYVILDMDKDQNTVSLCEKTQYFDDAVRPLWFVYSGMGSQWAGMGVQLMRIPIFAAAIERCHIVLKPKGLDIVNIITSSDETIFDNILHSFVGIAAVQIGLTDILRELGLKPNGIIGHSVGELGCAYADGCLSAEEMILCAYSRGLVSLQTPLTRGSMAAVGLGYEEIFKMCPPEIDVACHNGPGSSTISGPADVMRDFVARLTAQGVFAKEVPCSNIAYHSRYIADAAPDLLKYLKEIIKHPKSRSDRWLSTSVPQEKWHEDLARYCSAEYHTNNLLSPVLFEETSRRIPSNAVLVEVAPHGLLQAILKRSMSADCRHVPLTRRGHPDNALHLLQAVGDLYMHGFTPKVSVLYPQVQFPVSTETPMLSHLIKWNHSEKWNMSYHKAAEQRKAAACQFVKSIHDDEYRYLQGHVIRERLCYPFAAALVAAWDTVAMHLGLGKREVSVRFRDVHLYAQPALHDQRPLRLSVALHRGNGRFEIMNESSRVASGYVESNIVTHSKQFRVTDVDKMDMALNSHDIYQLLRERDYQYNGEFQSIERASACLSAAALVWRDNWVTLIDGILQLNMLRQPHCAVTLPTHIRRIDINLEEHHNYHLYQLNGKTVMRAIVDEVQDFTRCGGVLIQNIQFRWLPPVTAPYNQPKSVAVAVNTNLKGKKLTQLGGSECYTLALQSSRIGDLDSLHWVATHTQQSGVAVKVHYAGLNISDVKKAIEGTTKSWASNIYGMDFSGTTDSGERVMGVVSSGAASSVVRAQPELLWPVPAHWSLEDAATVPLAYAHALYCLRIKAQLRPRMTVLIHGGAGALGQAAISIALALNCVVFTTVSDMHKKRFLQELFPQLRDEFIGNSRDASFADMILTETKGLGCQIVLSCVTADLKNDTMKCCHLMGIILDTVQIVDRETYYLGMYDLEKDKTYSAIDFSSIFNPENYEEKKMLQTMLSEGIFRGYVRPLPRVWYAPHEAARAFRLLAASKHRGRVLLRMQHDTLQVIPSADTCHLLVCDEHPLGMQVADRLISRGANNLYIVCPIVTPYHWFKISNWRKHGVKVRTFNGSVHEDDVVKATMKDALDVGSIHGVFIVLTSVNNKQINQLVDAVDKLDSTVRVLCPSVKYFAVMTPNSAVGQETCLSRSKAKLPATMVLFSTLKLETNHRDIVDELEYALCVPHGAYSSPLAHTQLPSLLQQLDTVTGKNKSKHTENMTLQELGLAKDKIQAMRLILRDTYNIIMDEKDVSRLNINKIKEIIDNMSDDFEHTIGLATFFSFVDVDELMGTTDVVLLSTLAKTVTSINEFDVNEQYLCIVPGMEGHHARFRVLCERLKLPALVLQPGLDHLTETVQDTAHRYAQVLLKKIQIKNNFYLLGYESGILVALQIAAILEDHGFTGTIFCLGCSPEEFKTMMETHLGAYGSEAQLQDAVVRHMFTLMTGGDTNCVENGLRTARTWCEKVEAGVRSLLGRVPHSAQYARALIEAAMARIERARGYVAPVRALRSQLVLLRAATAHASPAPSTLQAHSQRPVAVHHLSAPLPHAATDMRVPAIINSYLATEILQQFEKQNLCDSYLPHLKSKLRF